MADRTQHDPERLGERSAPFIISPALLKAFNEATARAQDGEGEPKAGSTGSAEQDDPKLPVMFELSLDYPGGASGAASRLRTLMSEHGLSGREPGYDDRAHIFATLSLKEVRAIV